MQSRAAGHPPRLEPQPGEAGHRRDHEESNHPAAGSARPATGTTPGWGWRREARRNRRRLATTSTADSANEAPGNGTGLAFPVNTSKVCVMIGGPMMALRLARLATPPISSPCESAGMSDDIRALIEG